MPLHVCNGALLQCTFGMAPSTFVVLPTHQMLTSAQPAANILDHVPMVNVMPFGMCTSLANPTVASATAAASGVLTPMPCVPNTPSPWVAGAPTVILAGAPALDDVSKLMCTWGGVISIVFPGEVTEQIP
jgi:hypothetical protein